MTRAISGGCEECSGVPDLRQVKARAYSSAVGFQFLHQSATTLDSCQGVAVYVKSDSQLSPAKFSSLAGQRHCSTHRPRYQAPTPDLYPERIENCVEARDTGCTGFDPADRSE